jgi:Tfp pilus assembly protein PilF
LSGGDAWPRAVASADKALTLDPLLADGHTSRARIALNYELDWAAAERGYRRALELNPGYATARHWYGYYLLLTGRFKDAEVELRRALELDPLSPIVNANVGMAFYFGRQFDAAIAHWRQALEMHRNYRLLHNYIASAYVGKGMYAAAIAELEKSLALSGAGSWEHSLLAHAHGRLGRRDQARTILADVLRDGEIGAYNIAIVYAGLGEAGLALEWLNRSVDARVGAFNEVDVDPIFDPLRGDARFSMLLRRMRVPPRP